MMKASYTPSIRPSKQDKPILLIKGTTMIRLTWSEAKELTDQLNMAISEVPIDQRG